MEKSTQISVTATKDGPYVISGDFNLNLPNGEVKECSGETTLCRCGKSQNCPFCDKSHIEHIQDTCNVWF
jgi:CDGSH-type Zn-finger protein